MSTENENNSLIIRNLPEKSKEEELHESRKITNGLIKMVRTFKTKKII